MKKILFSGIQPSGELHIGNYLGALKNWIDLQTKYQTIYSIVDYHALTVPKDAATLRANVDSAAIDLLAIGIDPKKSIIFRQSDITEHLELAWIFNCLTPVPEVERMTQYKDFVKKHTSTANVGMLTYPILQAADILIYRAEYVPVGEDQLQHLELARVTARKFNNRYKNYFPEVKPIVPPASENARVMSLVNPMKKMSKSHGAKSYIALKDEPEIVTRKILKAVTDSMDQGTTLSGGHNLLMLFKNFATPSAYTRYEREYKLKKLSYSQLKNDLAKVIIEFLKPIQKKQAYYRKHPKILDKIMTDGAKRARKIAQKNIKEVRKIVGLD